VRFWTGSSSLGLSYERVVVVFNVAAAIAAVVFLWKQML